MYYIYHCNNDGRLGQTNNEAEAFRMAKAALKDTAPYDTYVTENSDIIGFGSTGRTPASADCSDPCTHGGSVLFGREEQ